MAKFRKKPVIVDAEQFWPYIHPYPDGVIVREGPPPLRIPTYYIETLEGVHIVLPGDWIITGVRGEKYPCKDEIFQLTYEFVVE